MKTFEVKILGQRYKVVSDEGEQYVQELADYVNQMLADVQKSARSVSTQGVVVMTALNIADELFKLRHREVATKKEVGKRVRRILRLIRSGVNSDKAE